jgi:long-chain fatty acid transport protein
MRRVHVLVLVGVLALGLVPVRQAGAQGFSVYEQGACAIGRGGASVALPCPDGSSVFFNPAGLAFVPGKTLSIGAAAIMPTGNFTNDTTGNVSSLNKKTYAVPNFYYAQSIGQALTAGVGVFAPYGLTTDWPDTSEGRFLGYKSKLQGLYIQPTVAYKLTERVSVGFGVDITYLNVELRQRVDLSVQKLPNGIPFSAIGVPAGTDFADVELAGHQYHYGFHFGLQAKASNRVTVGFRYLTGQKVDVSNGKLTTKQIATNLVTRVPLPGIPVGTSYDAIIAPQFNDGAPLESGQKGTTTLPLPAQFVIGTAIQATQKLVVLFDYQYTNWTAFKTLEIQKENTPDDPTITYEDYKNTSGFRFGAEYAASPSFVVRGGFVYNTAGAPDQTVTPNLPEGKRYWPTAGFSAKLSKAAHLDFFYLYLYQPDRAGRSTDGGMERPTADVNNGVYQFRGNLFGAALALRF